MGQSVPFFNYPALAEEHGSDVRAKIDDVLKRGAFILQKDVNELEEKLAKFIGVKHVVTVANGTDGLLLALRAAGMQPGDEVILPSHTYIATAAAVHFLGGQPVLVECGPDHMVDPKAIKAAVTPKTKFLMPVHINGRTCAMDQIMQIANEHSLIVVEDAAQALGSRYRGQHAGTFGIAGMFSFYPAKVLGCFGDGGCVVTNDDGMNRQLRLLRDHGRDSSGEVITWGLNSRLDNIHAAVLSVKLDHFEAAMERRRAIAKMYHTGLSDISELTLPPQPDADGNHFDIYQNYELEADRRDELKSFLADHKIGTLVQWGGKAVHQHKNLGFENVKLPVTERMTSRFLMLPMNTFISDADVEFVISKVREFYGY